jgi:hypothetical protein
MSPVCAVRVLTIRHRTSRLTPTPRPRRSARVSHPDRSYVTTSVCPQYGQRSSADASPVPHLRHSWTARLPFPTTVATSPVITIMIYYYQCGVINPRETDTRQPIRRSVGPDDAVERRFRRSPLTEGFTADGVRSRGGEQPARDTAHRQCDRPDARYRQGHGLSGATVGECPFSLCTPLSVVDCASRVTMSTERRYGPMRALIEPNDCVSVAGRTSRSRSVASDPPVRTGTVHRRLGGDGAARGPTRPTTDEGYS